MDFEDHKDVFTVANLLKVLCNLSSLNANRFLLQIWYRDLPESVLQKVSKESLWTDDSASCFAAVDVLPEPQKSLLFWLLDLISSVATYSEDNKMTVDNLGNFQTFFPALDL